MAHLIDKDALVAEIERRIESCKKQREDMLNVQCHTLADDASARMGELNCIQDFLDTLEVKEVDLEKEIEKYCRVYYNCNYPDQILTGRCSSVMPHIVEAARRFYELGLKAKQE